MSGPNSYVLHDRSVAITYYPGGDGPVIEGFGRLALVYTDANGSRRFGTEQVTTSTAHGLGTLVSVTLVGAPILAVTTLTLILPPVALSDELGSHAAITALAITSVGRDPVVLNEPELTYTVHHLSGEAKRVEIAQVVTAQGA